MAEIWHSVAKRLINGRGFKQDKVAERLNISAAAFNHWLNGRRAPKFNTILQVLYVLGLREIKFNENGNIIVDPHAFDNAVYGAPDGIRPQNEIAISAPEVSEKAASYPIFATRTEIQALPKIQPTHQHFLTGKSQIRGQGFWLKIKSEAMSSPSGLSIPDGALVLFDTGINPCDGHLALFHSPASPTLLFRQLQIEAGSKHLRGLNPKWPTVPLPKSSVCLGVAVEMRMLFSNVR